MLLGHHQPNFGAGDELSLPSLSVYYGLNFGLWLWLKIMKNVLSDDNIWFLPICLVHLFLYKIMFSPV